MGDEASDTSDIFIPKVCAVETRAIATESVLIREINFKEIEI